MGLCTCPSFLAGVSIYIFCAHVLCILVCAHIFVHTVCYACALMRNIVCKVDSGLLWRSATVHPAHRHEPPPPPLKWHRLLVGVRQKEWKPDEIWCPLDRELEKIQDSLTQCSSLKVAFDVIAKCSPSATPAELPPLLLTLSTEQSVQCAIGLLSWAAVFAKWTIRQNKKSCAITKPHGVKFSPPGFLP